MSAELLRRAATQMREDTEALGRGPWHPVVALAVADWLEDEAAHCEDSGDTPYAQALTVARAYLGES